MCKRLSLFLIFCYSLQVVAGEASGQATSDFIAVINTDCLRSPQTLPFEFVKHNASIHQKIQAYKIRLPENLTLQKAQQTVKAHSCVLSLSEEVHFKMAADPMRPEQTYLDVLDHQPGAEIFYNSSFAVRAPAVVGVVDTGIEYTHPELRPRIWPGLGFDFFNNDSDPMDDNGHGTHVAGLIGAQRNNGVGIEGIMGQTVQLMALKSLDSGGDGLLSDLVNAIRWAVDHGADVINLSLSSRIESTLMEQALEYAIQQGTVVVVAAGNDSEEITPTNFISPASYAPVYDGLMSVGSLDIADLSRSVFSNYSLSFVELSAVGQDGLLGIWSTGLNSTYRKGEGTSMAAPQVAGAAALAISFLKTHGYTYTPADIETIIKNSSVHATNLQSSFANGNRLNVERLGRYLLNSTLLTTSGGFDENP